MISKNAKRLHPVRPPRVRRRALWLAFTVPVMLTGCLNDTSTRQTDDLWPFAVGNTWEYVTELPAGLQDTLRLEVTERHAISSSEGTYSAYEIATTTGGSEAGSEYYSQGPDGVYAVAALSEPDSTLIRHLYLKTNAAVGESWNATVSGRRASLFEVLPLSETTITLASRNTKIVTPAGTFRCFVFHRVLATDKDTLDHYRYFAPGVGLVAEIGEARTAGFTSSRIVLNAYALK